MRRLLIGLFVILCALPASAQTSAYVTFGGGGTHDSVHNGGALTAALTAKAGPVLLDATGVDLLLRKGDTSPYRSETTSSGTTICRDTTNGQFADKSNCSAVAVSYAASFSGEVLVPSSPLFIGGGKRLDTHENPWFATAGGAWFREGGRWIVSVRVNAGKDYVSGLAALGFRVGK